MRVVSQHQMLEILEARMVITPSLVGKDTVGARRQQSAIALRERSDLIVEGNDFRWANERKIERVEVQTDPLAAEV